LSEGDSFTFDGDGVVSVRSLDGQTKVIHHVDGMSISKALPLHHGIVLLLEPTKNWGSHQNLVCLDSEGSVVWRAPLLDSSPYPKEYANVSIRSDGLLIAHTWGGLQVTIDPVTGQVTSVVFVK
jgi:outer membrane protein assembly factor BamB